MPAKRSISRPIGVSSAIPLTRLHDCEWPDANLVDMHAVFPSLHRSVAARKLPVCPDRRLSHRHWRDTARKWFIDSAKVSNTHGANIMSRRRLITTNGPPLAWASFGMKTKAGPVAPIGKSVTGKSGTSRTTGRRCGPVRTTITSALYVTAAKGIKAQFPGLMVGGPAAGGTGDVVHGELRPTAFLTGFLNACRTKSAPLDFFSWHTYSDDPHIFSRSRPGPSAAGSTNRVFAKRKFI